MIKRINIIAVVCIALISGHKLSAQEVDSLLTLENAISIALTNNYDLKIADNTLKQVENQNTIGNANLLPSLSVNGGAEYSMQDSKAEFAAAGSDEGDGGSGGDSNVGVITQEIDGAESTNYNGNVRLDYTIFSGFGNVYTYKKLQSSDAKQQLVFKQQMEATMIEVVQNYYEVCRAQQNLDLAKESMKISKERYQKVLDQKAYGQANQLDVLNAEVDMNSDSTSVLLAEQNMLTTIKSLNVSLGVSVSESYLVNDQVDFRNDLNEENVVSMAMLHNNSIQAQMKQENISELDFKITRSQKYPTLSAYSYYGYSRQDSEAGQLIYSQNNGLTGGVSLKFNVFNGRQQNIKEKNAKLAIMSEQERTNQLKAQIERDAANAYTDYAYKKRIVVLQESSLEQARLNFEQTKEMFQLGRVTSIEFRTAQQNLLDVANNYNEARYNAKVAEYSLLRITGELIAEK
ncbi:TolC family protein [Labilibacter sediminis]|nr:TolC family protein [Labilibacter sediminis]